ncbi:hypothetical protein CYLTODRAFT_495092, partial [Cylindrobasidium torrendii FP15055 ss-10]
MSETIATTLSKEIFHDAKRDLTVNSLVYTLGASYRDYLINSFRTTYTKSSPPSERPSQPSFDRIEDHILEQLKSASSSYSTSREKVLARDGYQCKVTRFWHQRSVAAVAELAQLVDESGYGSGEVQACHIVNEAIMQGVDRDSPETKKRAAAGFLRILDTFGLSEVKNDFLKENGIHSLKNLISLSNAIHPEFDDLCLWFEPTDTEHTYTV